MYAHKVNVLGFSCANACLLSLLYGLARFYLFLLDEAFGNWCVVSLHDYLLFISGSKRELLIPMNFRQYFMRKSKVAYFIVNVYNVTITNQSRLIFMILMAIWKEIRKCVCMCVRSEIRPFQILKSHVDIKFCFQMKLRKFLPNSIPMINFMQESGWDNPVQMRIANPVIIMKKHHHKFIY